MSLLLGLKIARGQLMRTHCTRRRSFGRRIFRGSLSSLKHAIYQEPYGALKKAGLDRFPWPTSIDVVKTDEIRDFLPTSTALNETFYGLHELMGAWYYRTRY